MTTTTESGVLAHTLQALAAHMLTHDLTGTVKASPTEVTIYVGYATADRWVASLHVDQQTIRPVTNDRNWEHVLVEGRLPDTGTRVSVRWVRRGGLTVVAS